MTSSPTADALFYEATRLMDEGRSAEAEAAYRQALELDPESLAAWSNLGVLLACLQREDEAEQCYRRALALAPGYRTALFNLAYVLLRQGRYEEGWRCLEARTWYAQLEKLLDFPRWQGEPVAGKSVLIGIEAGQGDMIHFCRYAPLIKARGAARVAILCHPGLKTVLASIDGIDEAIGLNDPFTGSWDYWVPPFSLPFLFQTRADTIPADLPYLSAPPERVAEWAGCQGNRGGALRVGLVWKGNPGFENDADRSLPSLRTLAPLGDVPGIHYFSLQKGAVEDEAANPPPGLAVTDLGPRITDFADTAAIIMNLDLVVAVDTSVAHLAGALGRPCWILLPDYKTDWRWLKDRIDSPWYPQVMRLFRQKARGDWGSVVAEVKAALQILVAART